tara:strand:- start:64 stop:450 length:387 start_codon:yes stop_codon:yes gene_type:complete
MKSGKHFNMDNSHRKLMFRNLATSLFRSEIIKTTVPKAKELRRKVEPLITIAKVDSAGKRRLAFNRLRNREIVTKLFEEIGPRFKERNGGYLRIMKCGPRAGDRAPMAYIELIGREPKLKEELEESED